MTKLTDAEELLAQGALVWLDADGQLRIQIEASAELKDLARGQRAALVAALQALGGVSRLRVMKVMNVFAVTTASGNLPSYVAAAIRSAGLNCLAVCANAADGRGEPYEAWRKRYVLKHFDQLCDPAELQRWIERQQRLREPQGRATLAPESPRDQNAGNLELFV